MTHYLNYVENAIKNHWNLPAFTNYGRNSFTFGEVAEQIEKLHIIFQLLDIEKDIDSVNYELMLLSMEVCYEAIRDHLENATDDEFLFFKTSLLNI